MADNTTIRSYKDRSRHVVYDRQFRYWILHDSEFLTPRWAGRQVADSMADETKRRARRR